MIFLGNCSWLYLLVFLMPGTSDLGCIFSVVYDVIYQHVIKHGAKFNFRLMPTHFLRILSDKTASDRS